MTSKSKRASHLLGLCAGAALAACATRPDLGPKPNIASAADYESSRAFADAEAAWPSDEWWKAYGDDELNALIAEALAGSPTLVAAGARVRKAEADAAQVGAQRLPALSGQAGFETTRRDVSSDKLETPTFDAFPNGWSGQASAGMTLHYQLDFFGKNRAAFAAASSIAEAAWAEAAEARLQLSTAVALAYADLVRLNSEKASLAESARLRAESERLVSNRTATGLENDGPRHQAASELAATRADIASVEAAIARKRNELAALLGKGPDRGLAISAASLSAPATRGLPQRIELELISRRPDIVAARRYAEAAAARIKVARADFYPNVNLMAVAGLQAFPFGSLAGDELGFAEAGPSTTLPIFSGGRIRGAYRAARADYDEAVALYDQTLANAFREAADAIGDLKSVETELSELRRSLAEAESSYEVARRRYEGGLASYIDTLSIESSLIERRRAVAILEAKALALDITLVRALGGGFNEA